MYRPEQQYVRRVENVEEPAVHFAALHALVEQKQQRRERGVELHRIDAGGNIEIVQVYLAAGIRPGRFDIGGEREHHADQHGGEHDADLPYADRRVDENVKQENAQHAHGAVVGFEQVFCGEGGEQQKQKSEEFQIEILELLINKDAHQAQKQREEHVLVLGFVQHLVQGRGVQAQIERDLRDNGERQQPAHIFIDVARIRRAHGDHEGEDREGEPPDHAQHLEPVRVQKGEGFIELVAEDHREVVQKHRYDGDDLER